MALDLTSKQVEDLLSQAYEQAVNEGPQLEEQVGEWVALLRGLLSPDSRMTYLPVLCVCLVARSLSGTVDVRRVKSGDEYSASLVGQRLVEFARDHQVDMRTDSTNVMNSQPFNRQPELTADLSNGAGYDAFFAAVQDVQAMTSDQARRVLALALHLGRQNWPDRKRRVQRNQAVQAASGQQALLEAEPAYFILNQSSRQDVEHHDGADFYGFHANVTSARALVDAGSGAFVFYRTSNHEDAPMSFVGAGRVTAVQDQGQDVEGRATWRARIEDYQAFANPVPKAAGAPAGWNWQHSIARISQEAFDRLLHLGSGQQEHVEPLTVAGLRAACTARGLLLDDAVLAALVGALESGKNVVLTGPPGTAKTTLAVLVARLATQAGHCTGHTLTTATADWSTYDTIGGLAPQANGTLLFRYGLFLQALDDQRWLIVDELNRSNFDRAFGPLFTVLAGEDAVLQHQHRDSKRTVRVRHEGTAAEERYHDVVVPSRWRMIATINNFDKSLLFEMSFALMRRFAFVEVPAPPDAQYLELIDRELDGEANDVAGPARQAVAALLPLRAVKEIGPAIYIDAVRMARSMLLGSDLPADKVTLQVFYALLLPQFEGIEEPQGQRLLRTVSKAVGPQQASQARRVLREVLGLDLGEAARLQDADDTTGQASHEPSEA